MSFFEQINDDDPHMNTVHKFISLKTRATVTTVYASWEVIIELYECHFRCT